MIVAQTLTDPAADDPTPSQVAPLLDQIGGPIARVTADGAYDGASTYQTIATHGDDIEVVIPVRATAVPGGEPGPPTQRDRHLQMITDQDEHAWREALRGFTDPNLFTAEMYRAHVEGKPELDGARATLDALGVPDAMRLGVLYADRKQKWLEYLVQDGSVAAFHNRVAE